MSIYDNQTHGIPKTEKYSYIHIKIYHIFGITVFETAKFFYKVNQKINM